MVFFFFLKKLAKLKAGKVTTCEWAAINCLAWRKHSETVMYQVQAIRHWVVPAALTWLSPPTHMLSVGYKAYPTLFAQVCVTEPAKWLTHGFLSHLWPLILIYLFFPRMICFTFRSAFKHSGRHGTLVRVIVSQLISSPGDWLSQHEFCNLLTVNGSGLLKTAHRKCADILNICRTKRSSNLMYRLLGFCLFCHRHILHRFLFRFTLFYTTQI